MSEPPEIPPKAMAVALRYDNSGAPRVTAKGRGEVAARILETAAAHGVPIEEDAALVQALAQIEIDEEIPIELYEAVAAVLRYILSIK
ncbi:EscU/YscU/HrcU family type III secretion system export apparatus switch protein [Stappia sp. ES.058]|uniref:EscU/YscU/HrcU family type III secretion system export apparatus switch protein n=1 Tax=Stappia sp. ES.058 TaxID=1881061 RepID=UPI0008793DF6|nr:EscU/YscU/HrcU family type III secretion system export apparatus switch protein [Stappia sp. ES.058]SDU19301.1 flagellar biosynthesis protein [Stappia sp. ES.058]